MKAGRYAAATPYVDTIIKFQSPPSHEGRALLAGGRTGTNCLRMFQSPPSHEGRALPERHDLLGGDDHVSIPAQP